jgi:aurora kinase
MATRALESRFERMSVNDENDPGNNGTHYYKSKVHEMQSQSYDKASLFL